MTSQPPASPPSRFTDALREAAGDGWDRVVNHRFADELAAGTIDRDVLRRYLIQDHRFLDAFVVLLSSAVSRARCLSDRVPGCQFLALITGKENTYFERSFEALGGLCADEDNRGDVPDADVTRRFVKLMRDAAMG
eukprot:CAMPEP_0183301674 /NCGR_PEP_ID=MMETSP0160_2-20130417/7711_1 /TAXON_ID=2839 ORGANISM="Odontella Sinensis, Strain Grunow 1884" /NCGR_SAMPLE_ID=MMETSP0160_2 /ASSEMBLY_ACC=CAM_ASM_000250 /LENGTH=135 /DNA_ID=CAMNT_0025464329 /DNA_START=25 /DNA_END=428 /DNA_ORIENTATION=+